MKLTLVKVLTQFVAACLISSMLLGFITFLIALWCVQQGAPYFDGECFMLTASLFSAFASVILGALTMACEDWERRLTLSNTYRRANNLKITIP